MHLKWAYFVAFLFAALALGPAMAHLLELPNKIGLPAEEYFTVQAIYRGWALLGIVVFGALASTLALAILLRRARAPSAWAVVAFLCIVATQIVFWTVVYPTNQATHDWTVVPDDWRELRMRWEYGHAAGAVFNLAAVAALVLSVLRWRIAEAGGDGAPPVTPPPPIRPSSPSGRSRR